MPSPPSRAKHRLLLAILAAAFALRIAGIGFGIPLLDDRTGFYHPDEPKIVRAAATFPAHVVENRDLRYPTLYPYLLGLLALPLRLAPVASAEQHFLWVYVLARVATALCGTAGVWLLFVLARRFGGEALGLVAAALLATAPFPVQNGAWATTDVASSVALTAFVLLAGRAWRPDGGLGPRLWSGVALGALAATKYTGAIAAIAVPVVFLTARDEHGRRTWRSADVPRFARDGVLFALAAAATLLATTPGIAVHPDAFAESFRYETERLAQFSLPRSDPFTWWLALRATGEALGWPLAVIGLAGLFGLARRRPALPVLVLAFYVAFGSALAPRYVVLVAPMLALAAAHLVLRLATTARPALRRLGWALGIGTAAWSLLLAVLGLVARTDDPRTAAAHFVAERLPDGATAGELHVTPRPEWRAADSWKYPRLDPVRHPPRDFLERPDVLVLSSYDVDKIVGAIESGRLTPELAWPADANDQWYRRTPPTPAMFAFYVGFLTSGEYVRAAEFLPNPLVGWVPIEFAPPSISIWRRRE